MASKFSPTSPSLKGEPSCAPLNLEAERLLTVEQAAELLGSTMATLNTWRCKGDGPPFIRNGRSIRYRVGDLIAYTEARRVVPASPSDPSCA